MVTLWQMMREAGTSDPGLLGHSLVRVNPGFRWLQTSGPEPVQYVDHVHWQPIKAEVIEHVRLHIRGGVHALPGGEEWFETDEQFNFNTRMRKNVMWTVQAGKYDSETLTVRNRRINSARVQVDNAMRSGTAAKIERAGRKLARLRFRLWGIEPWKTLQEVISGDVADLVFQPDVDHDNARENQQRANREQAEKTYGLEIARIAALEGMQLEPDPGFEDFDAMRAAAAQKRDEDAG